MYFSSMLKKLRTEAGYKQQDLANLLNVSQQAVAKWENGRTEPNISILLKIAKIFNCTVDNLIDEEFDLDEASQIAVRSGHSIVISNFETMCADLDELTLDRIHAILGSLRRLQNNSQIDVKSKQYLFSCITEMIGRIEFYVDEYQSAVSKNFNDETSLYKAATRFRGFCVEIISSIISTIDKSRFNAFDNEHALQRKNVTMLRYYSNPASAGSGNFLDDNPSYECISVIASKNTEDADFVIQVSGDSMEPLYHNGDKLLIKQKQVLSEGEFGVFIVNGEAFVKKLGCNELISVNPAYKNLPITESDYIYCVGKVISVLDEDDII